MVNKDVKQAYVASNLFVWATAGRSCASSSQRKWLSRPRIFDFVYF